MQLPASASQTFAATYKVVNKASSHQNKAAFSLGVLLLVITMGSVSEQYENQKKRWR